MRSVRNLGKIKIFLTLQILHWWYLFAFSVTITKDSTSSVLLAWIVHSLIAPYQRDLEYEDFNPYRGVRLSCLKSGVSGMTLNYNQFGWSEYCQVLPSLPLFSGQLGVVVPFRVLYMRQIHLFKNYSYSIGPHAKKPPSRKKTISETTPQKCKHERTMNVIS